MIEFRNVLISDEIIDKHFVCDLNKCKGACCVEGDLGAPLTLEETKILEENYDKIEPYLTPEGKKAIEEQGKFIEDWEEEFSTTTIDEKECAYAYYDDKKLLKCGIEDAWKDGKIDFQKPISCHLYPVRERKLSQFIALNYDYWDICNDACSLGMATRTPIYVFVKGALIRRFGNEWYEEFEKVAEEYQNNNNQ